MRNFHLVAFSPARQRRLSDIRGLAVSSPDRIRVLSGHAISSVFNANEPNVRSRLWTDWGIYSSLCSSLGVPVYPIQPDKVAFVLATHSNLPIASVLRSLSTVREQISAGMVRGIFDTLNEAAKASRHLWPDVACFVRSADNYEVTNEVLLNLPSTRCVPRLPHPFSRLTALFAAQTSASQRQPVSTDGPSLQSELRQSRHCKTRSPRARSSPKFRLLRLLPLSSRRLQNSSFSVRTACTGMCNVLTSRFEQLPAPMIENLDERCELSATTSPPFLRNCRLSHMVSFTVISACARA